MLVINTAPGDSADVEWWTAAEVWNRVWSRVWNVEQGVGGGEVEWWRRRGSVCYGRKDVERWTGGKCVGGCGAGRGRVLSRVRSVWEEARMRGGTSRGRCVML